MKIRYEILGLDCPNCAAKLESIIASKDGIDSAKINFLTEKLTVETNLSEEEAFGILSVAARAFSKEVKIIK